MRNGHDFDILAALNKRVGLLYQFDTLEQAHDFEDPENFDDSKDPICIVGRGDAAPSNTLLHKYGSAIREVHSR
jgi:hypothetical protein